MGVVAVVGVEGGVLVGYNRLCRVICGVDLERFFCQPGQRCVSSLSLVAVLLALAMILLC